MPNTNLGKLLRAALTSGVGVKPVPKAEINRALSRIDDVSERTRKRSERISEEKKLGARITTHRITL